MSSFNLMGIIAFGFFTVASGGTGEVLPASQIQGLESYVLFLDYKTRDTFLVGAADPIERVENSIEELKEEIFAGVQLRGEEKPLLDKPNRITPIYMSESPEEAYLVAKYLRNLLAAPGNKWTKWDDTAFDQLLLVSVDRARTNIRRFANKSEREKENIVFKGLRTLVNMVTSNTKKKALALLLIDDGSAQEVPMVAYSLIKAFNDKFNYENRIAKDLEYFAKDFAEAQKLDLLKLFARSQLDDLIPSDEELSKMILADLETLIQELSVLAHSASAATRPTLQKYLLGEFKDAQNMVPSKLQHSLDDRPPLGIEASEWILMRDVETALDQATGQETIDISRRTEDLRRLLQNIRTQRQELRSTLQHAWHQSKERMSFYRRGKAIEFVRHRVREDFNSNAKELLAILEEKQDAFPRSLLDENLIEAIHKASPEVAEKGQFTSFPMNMRPAAYEALALAALMEDQLVSEFEYAYVTGVSRGSPRTPKALREYANELLKIDAARLYVVSVAEDLREFLHVHPSAQEENL